MNGIETLNVFNLFANAVYFQGKAAGPEQLQTFNVRYLQKLLMIKNEAYGKD